MQEATTRDTPDERDENTTEFYVSVALHGDRHTKGVPLSASVMDYLCRTQGNCAASDVLSALEHFIDVNGDATVYAPEKSSEEYRMRLWLEEAICCSYHEGHTSEGQAAKLLGVDRLTFRGIYQTSEIVSGHVPEDHPIIP